MGDHLRIVQIILQRIDMPTDGITTDGITTDYFTTDRFDNVSYLSKHTSQSRTLLRCELWEGSEEREAEGR